MAISGSITTINAPLVWNNGYILSVDLSLGWNQSPSRLTLQIVDVPELDFINTSDGDPKPTILKGSVLRDIENPPTTGYIPPDVGSFATFNIPDTPIKFQGIVVSHEEPKKIDGAKIYTTTLHDTREVINNIPVIISHMGREVTLPQVINAFGWWDVWWPQVGRLNMSDVNDFGMPWERIRDSINGKPISAADLGYARMPPFQEIVADFTADGFYFNIDGGTFISSRDHDDNPNITWKQQVNDKVNINMQRPSGIPLNKTSKQVPPDPPFNPLSNPHTIAIRNVSRGSGQVIHLETGFVIDANTQTASGLVSPDTFEYFNKSRIAEPEIYTIDINDIPIQEKDFRIKGDIVYLGELIDKVANWGQFDWIVDSTNTQPDGKHLIHIKTIDRRKANKFDDQAIDSWISTLKETGGSRVMSYSKSRELRNENTMAVVFGDNVEQLTRKIVAGQWYGVQKYDAALTQDSYNNFAGGMSNFRTQGEVDFTHLNLHNIIPPFQKKYQFDEVAFRCALYDHELFGSLWNYLFLIQHPMIADLSNILGIVAPGVGIDLRTSHNYIYQYDLKRQDSSSVRKLLTGQVTLGDRALEILESIGNTIYQTAQAYWGRQFIVKFSSSILVNWNLTSSAFQGFSYNDATAFFREPDGVKVRGFVQFKNVDPFAIVNDLLHEEDILMVDNNDLLVNFAEVYNRYLSYNPKTLLDMYVAANFKIVDNRWIVAEIAHPIKILNGSYKNQTELLAQRAQKGAFLSREQQILNGLDGTGMEFQCLYPQFAFIPMKAKYECYGPWVSEGIIEDNGSKSSKDEKGTSFTFYNKRYKIKNGYNGRLEITKDTDISPWVLGGLGSDPFLGLNKAGNARVQNASSNLVKPITGTIEVEGWPVRNIGDVISDDFCTGNVSDIVIRFSKDKIFTTYIVKNYTAKKRDFNIENFKMGSVLSLGTSRIRENMPKALIAFGRPTEPHKPRFSVLAKRKKRDKPEEAHVIHLFTGLGGKENQMKAGTKNDYQKLVNESDWRKLGSRLISTTLEVGAMGNSVILPQPLQGAIDLITSTLKTP